MYELQCGREYRNWLVSIARTHAEQDHPDDQQVHAEDLLKARETIIVWIGMAMAEFVVNGDDTYLQQFRAFNSHAQGDPFPDEDHGSHE